jgi:diguanylate cyclase (GGDEF)-like protein
VLSGLNIILVGSLFNFKQYIWLLILSALAVWQAFEVTGWDSKIHATLEFSPYLIISFGIFISVFMNRMLPVLLLLVIGLLNFASFNYLPTVIDSQTFSTLLLFVIPLLLPINIIILSCLPEKGVNLSFYNIFISVVFLLQIVMVIFIMDFLPVNLVEVFSYKVNIKFINLTMSVAIVVVLSWLFIIFRNAYIENIKEVDRTLVFVLILMSLAFNQIDQPYVFTWLSAISALLIVIAIIFDSHKVAYVDSLTGLNSRLSLLENFSSLGRTYSVAMVDIDHFKKFNDTYGHYVGDQVLILVADELSKVSFGKVYRYGGEEFTIVFPKKSAEQAEQELELILSNIENLELNLKQEINQKITVSFGVAQKNEWHKKPEDVLRSADEALYQAKERGRNRIVVYEEELT